MDFCMICWIGIQSKAFVGTLSNRIFKKKKIHQKEEWMSLKKRIESIMVKVGKNKREWKTIFQLIAIHSLVDGRGENIYTLHYNF